MKIACKLMETALFETSPLILVRYKYSVISYYMSWCYIIYIYFYVYMCVCVCTNCSCPPEKARCRGLYWRYD